jgi:hypothetical protein
MMYRQKKVTPPKGLRVGAEAGVRGEGLESFRIVDIVYYKDEEINTVHLDCGWSEPLSKIYLLNGKSHFDASCDPECNFQVAIGECDNCGFKFPDSCVYYPEGKKIICVNCKKEPKTCIKFCTY